MFCFLCVCTVCSILKRHKRVPKANNRFSKMKKNVSSREITFSPDAPVSTNVEKTGRECLVCAGQHSMVAPMGRQNIGTDSGNGKDS